MLIARNTLKATLKDAMMEATITGVTATLTYLIDGVPVGGVAGLNLPKQSNTNPNTFESSPNQNASIALAGLWYMEAAKRSVPFLLGQVVPNFVSEGNISGYTESIAITPDFVDTQSRFPSVIKGIKDQGRAMRVMSIVPETRNTGNGEMMFVVVRLASAPPIAESTGTCLLQRKTETYPVDWNNGQPTRTQIVLTYTDPNTGFTFPQTPATATQYKYQETYRVVNTFYYDDLLRQISHDQDIQWMKLATGTVNTDNFRGKPPRTWLCSEVDIATTDGGYSKVVSAEWIYNEESWDTLVTFELLGQPVVISDNSLAKVLPFLKGVGSKSKTARFPIPDPVIADKGGIARIPECFGKAHNALCQAIIFKTDVSSGW